MDKECSNFKHRLFFHSRRQELWKLFDPLYCIANSYNTNRFAFLFLQKISRFENSNGLIERPSLHWVHTNASRIEFTKCIIDIDRIVLKHFQLVLVFSTLADNVWPRNTADSLYISKKQYIRRTNAKKKGSKDRFMISCRIVWLWLNDIHWNIRSIANIQLCIISLANNYSCNDFCFRYCTTSSVLLMVTKKLTNME